MLVKLAKGQQKGQHMLDKLNKMQEYLVHRSHGQS